MHVRFIPLFLMSFLTTTAACLFAHTPATLAAEYVPGEVLVRFLPDATPTVRSDIARSVDGSFVARQPGARFDKLRVSAAADVEEIAARLSRDTGVEWAEPNYRGALHGDPDGGCPDCPQDPFLMELGGNQWGVHLAGVPSLWRHGGGGTGLVIAIVDSGLDSFSSPHGDLSANVVVSNGMDFIDGDTNPTDQGSVANPQWGHGTHVAGIAGAVSDDQGICGVAYCAKLLIVRVANCNDPGSPTACTVYVDAVAQGVKWAADNGADVINLSLGFSSYSNALRDAVQYAIGVGAVVVASTGNENTGTVRYPAKFPEVIGVGASGSGDNVWGSGSNGSNWGDGLDVVAPGKDVWSTYISGSYSQKTGTSMAAPFVSGLAALLLERNPDMSPLEVEEFLKKRAKQISADDRDGAGRVNFRQLTDMSDLGTHGQADHEFYFWEWLGTDTSPETPSGSESDGDFRQNDGNHDAYDDGVFPGTFDRLPWKPQHLSLSDPNVLDVTLQVCDWGGYRYSDASPTTRVLHLDSWADWNSVFGFEEGATEEHIVLDHEETPSSWGANQTTASLFIPTPNGHILGNPLEVRTRVSNGSAAASTGSVPYGEVEDDLLINFFESFDQDAFYPDDVPFMQLAGWSLAADPAVLCSNHATWQMAVTDHPNLAEACNGIIETVHTLSSPPMDWTEYTFAKLRYWRCHQYFDCGVGDLCRVRVVVNGVLHDVTPIPIGSGILDVDLSAYVGNANVRVEFVEETDEDGWIAIDDVAIWAGDDDRAATVADLAVGRIAGSRQLDLIWTAVSENATVASPPSEPLAEVYDIRYSKDPIGNDADFFAATPFRPEDLLVGSAVPSPPGTVEIAGFCVPSAHQDYYVAIRTLDEVVNIPFLSDSPQDVSAAALGVIVASLNDTTGAQGETAELRFVIQNTGNTDDWYAIEASDTDGWDFQTPLPDMVSLAPGTNAEFTARMTIDPAADDGDSNTVTLTARSLTDTATLASDSAFIEVDGTTSDVSSPVALVEEPGLRLASANPFRERLEFELDLPDASHLSLRIYDASGRLVRAVFDGPAEEGRLAFSWDGHNADGDTVPSGVYFARAISSNWMEVRRIHRIR